MSLAAKLEIAKAAIRDADAVLIGAGAGTAVPTVRHLCESTAYRFTAPFIRINPRDLHGRAGAIPIPLGGLEGLRQLGLER